MPATHPASSGHFNASSTTAQGRVRGGGAVAQAPTTTSTANPTVAAQPTISDQDLLKVVQDLIDGKASPNPLNSFWQVAYHWRLFILTDEDLYTKTNKPSSIGALYTAMDGLSQITIAETAATTYNIKSVETIAKVGPNFETRNVNVFQFKIEIVEPISVGFFDVLKQSALSVGVKNLNKCPYLLELSFRAYDENGAVLTNPLAGLPSAEVDSDRWVWQVQIVDIDTHIDASGGQYTLTAQVYNDGAIEADILTVPKTTTIQGSTIRSVLKDLGARMTDSFVARYGSNLVTYEFVMHKISHPPAAIGDPDPNNYQMTSRNPNYSTISMVPMAGSRGEIKAQVAPGTAFSDIVLWIMANNDHTQQLGLDPNQTNMASIIDRIETDVEITGYDYVSANYKKKVYIHIWPYYTQAILTGPPQRDNAKKDPKVQMQMLRELLTRNFLRKHYDYLYTGLNTEVLEFDIRTNFKWNALLPNLGGQTGPDHFEASALIPPTLRPRATDAATLKQNQQAAQEYDAYVTQYLIGLENQAAKLRTQVAPVQTAYNDALTTINNPNAGAFEKIAAQSTIQSTKAQLDDLTAKQLTTGRDLAKIHEAINQNNALLEADRAALNTRTTVPNYAEDLLRSDGSVVNTPGGPQYEYFNHAISFRQGYLEARAQAGTGFQGSNHQARSTFGALIDQLYQPETTALVNVELTVRGDPYWLGSSNLSRSVLLRNNNDQAGSEKLYKNLPNWVAGDQTFLLSFRYPILIGDDGAPVFKTDDTFNGIYRVVEVTSTFSEGSFKQRLKGQVISLINLKTAFGAIQAGAGGSTGGGAASGASSRSTGVPSGPSGPVTPALTTAAQQQNAQTFRDALKASAAAKGVTLSDANIDGIVANAYRESGMKPNSNSIDSNGLPSAGLLQWNGPRNDAFTAYIGTPPQNATIAQQADYTIHELQTSERGTLNALQGATTADASQQVWITKYERPADPTAGAARNRSFLPNLYGTGS